VLKGTPGARLEARTTAMQPNITGTHR